MGALLESGMVGNIGLKHLRVIKEDTIKKWDDLGFLEGLAGHQKDNIAQLYENQASYLINEAAVSDASGSFETVVFPIIRRVFSKLLANDIVSVQAMNLPIGKLFYFIPKIMDTKKRPFGWPNTADTDPQAGYTSSQSLYDRFYEGSDEADQGLFDYSRGEATTNEVNPHAFVTFDAGVPSTSAAAISGESISNFIIVLSGFSTDGQGKMIGADGNVMDTEEFLASLQVEITGNTTANNGVKNFNVVTQKYGKGIVEYGEKAGSGLNKYNTICDQEGKIY